MDRTPDFNNLLKVLRRERPTRPTLFEFFLNTDLYAKLAELYMPGAIERYHNEIGAYAYAAAGYDFIVMVAPGFGFDIAGLTKDGTISLNSGARITNRAEFEAFKWRNPMDARYSVFDDAVKFLPKGMKIIACGSYGVLENVTELVGYDNLCFMLRDDPDLAAEIFEAVGSRLVKYYSKCVEYDIVGGVIVGDDWAFNTSTMISPDDLRTYVFPYHRQIVAAAHAAGKPAILHSCGYLEEVMDEIIDDLKYDAKHSYEDNIISVEAFYEKYHNRIAILGGIDIGFICSSTPEEVFARTEKLISQTNGCTGWAVGTGNSVPAYVPDKNYFAMISAAGYDL